MLPTNEYKTAASHKTSLITAKCAMPCRHTSNIFSLGRSPTRKPMESQRRELTEAQKQRRAEAQRIRRAKHRQAQAQTFILSVCWLALLPSWYNDGFANCVCWAAIWRRRRQHHDHSFGRRQDYSLALRRQRSHPGIDPYHDRAGADFRSIDAVVVQPSSFS